MDAAHDRTHTGQVGAAARVACTVVAEGDTERTLGNLLGELLVVREVLLLITLGIVEAVGHHDAAAVNTLPEAHGEGVSLAAVIEGACAPHQFLRREADQTAVGGSGGHVIREPEAVWQKHVVGLCTEFPTVEGLSKQDVADPGFR